MKKRKIWLFILIFVLFAAVTATAVGFLRVNRFVERADSIERRITPDGTIYETISTGGDSLSLRKITADGLVTGYYPLPKPKELGMYTACHTIGISGDMLYLYSYETAGNTPERCGEAVLEYNMTDGKSRIIANIQSPGTLEEYDVFFAKNTAGNAVFFGYLDKRESLLTLRRIDISNGGITDFPGVYTPFPPAAISVAQTNELFVLSQDSHVYMLEGEDWTSLYEPVPGEAAANMTSGENGEIYLFLASESGTHVMVSTSQNRSFVPMDIDTGGLIKLHVSGPDSWVGLDELYRYVVSTGGGKYVIETLKASFWDLWDICSLLIVFFGSFAGTVLFSVIRLIVINRRFHLLPKLLVIIIPMFTLGMYVLISIADGYVKKVAETGLRESILEYAYDTIDEIDAERFGEINWDNPLGDEYYNELRAQMNKLSGYRIMEVKGEAVSETHNAYGSFWVYRIDGGKVYTAVCGHYVAGLEAKYFEYNAQVAQREKMIISREPTSTYLGGSDSNIRWMAILYPIIAGEELVGYLEVARPMTAIDKAVYSVTHRIFLAGLSVFAAVITALILVIAFSTKTLGKLRRGALAVSGGEYSAQVHSKSWDETGEIASAFNKMAHSVETSIREITRMSDGYSRFVPEKLIELLGKDTISDIKPGDYKRLTATHILLYTDSFDNLRDKEFFDALGRFYNITIPCIATAGGLISQYSARGFSALFESSPETALRAVMAAFEALGRADKNPCHMFMSYSGATLGVTGSGEHLNMITVSRLVYESYAVGTAGKCFGTRLIVSQSAFEKMGGAAERYNYRFLGFLRDEGELRRLYDFYDCDTAEIKVKKIAAKERFENGVELYYAGEYSKARRVFVGIIKEFPEDIASREYLRRSHAGLESGGKPRPVIKLL